MKQYTCPKNPEHDGIKAVSATRPAAQDSQIICAECGEFIDWASPKDLVRLHTDLVNEINQSKQEDIGKERLVVEQNQVLRQELEQTRRDLVLKDAAIKVLMVANEELQATIDDERHPGAKALQRQKDWEADK